MNNSTPVTEDWTKLYTTTIDLTNSANNMTFETPSVKSTFYFDDVRFNVTEFNRTVHLSGLGFSSITESKASSESTHTPLNISPIYNGFIGIAPY